jgi:hypothetical protein
VGRCGDRWRRIRRIRRTETARARLKLNGARPNAHHFEARRDGMRTTVVRVGYGQYG